MSPDSGPNRKEAAGWAEDSQRTVAPGAQQSWGGGWETDREGFLEAVSSESSSLSGKGFTWGSSVGKHI